MSATPRGVTIVDSPLPCSAMGIVDDRNLTEDVALAWKGRQLYEAAIMDQMEALARGTFSGATPMSKTDHQLFERSIKAEQAHVRSLERKLGDMLFTMKAVMLRPGREGEWDEFLEAQEIPLATAKVLVAHSRRRLKRKRSGRSGW